MTATLEVHGDLGDTEIEDGKIEESLVEDVLLERVVLHFGSDALLDASQWGSLLDLSKPVFDLAEKNRQCCAVTRREGKGYRTGYAARDVLKWIRECKIPVTFTGTAMALVGMSPDEAFAVAISEQTYPFTSTKAAEIFGIPEAIILSAISRGKIRNGQSWANASRILPSSLLDWIKADGIECKWSLMIAGQVARKRIGISAESTVEASVPSSLDEAITEFETAKRDEAENDRKVREEIWAAYRVILSRRKSLSSNDRKVLTEIMNELGFDRQRVELHKDILDELEDLERKHDDLKSAEENRDALAAAKDAEKKRAKAAKKDLEQRHTSSFGRVEKARQAGDLIIELKRQHPDLFPAS